MEASKSSEKKFTNPFLSIRNANHFEDEPGSPGENQI